MLRFRYSGIPVYPPPGCLGWFVAYIHRPIGGILDHDYGVCSLVRLSSARRENVPICRSPLRPAFSWTCLAPSQRTSAGRSPPKENWLGKKDANPSWNQSFTPHQRRFGLRLRMPSQLPATPRCWSPARPDHRANCEGSRLRRCPVWSNAQVPANWPFLQILAQSRETHPA